MIGANSGFFIIDPQGSWDGTAFTITVPDTKSRFYYSFSAYYAGSCKLLGQYITGAGPQVHFLFALNPVIFS